MKNRPETAKYDPHESPDSLSFPNETEALALREIEAGFVPPTHIDEALIGGFTLASESEQNVRQSAANLYRATTAAQRGRVRAVIEALRTTGAKADRGSNAVLERQKAQRKHTRSRVKPEMCGRKGVLDWVNLLKYPIAAAALMVMGWFSLQIILAKSGDLSGAAFLTGDAAEDTGLKAGAFVFVISLGALLVEVLHSKLRSDAAKDRFHLTISVVGYICTALAALTFALLYAGTMGANAQDPYGSLDENSGSIITAIAAWDALPICLIGLVLIGEPLAAASLWIRGELIFDEFYPSVLQDTDEQIQLADQREKQEHDADRRAALLIELRGLADAIELGEQAFIDRHIGVFRSRSEKQSALQRLRSARAQLAEAEAACDLDEDPGLFRIRPLGGA